MCAKFSNPRVTNSHLSQVPMVQIDSQYFGRLVVAPLNIVLYNVFSSHGPDLYGTEPWTFYIFNGFLNFNIMFFAALVALPLHVCAVYPSNCDLVGS